MDNSEKQQALEKMLSELKSGKNEAEVKKEFDSLFGEGASHFSGKNNWEASSQVPVTTNAYEEQPYQDVHPLVVFASENGALRALLDNINIDLNNSDDVSSYMLKVLMERLCQIKIHYRKLEELLFPYLINYGVETLPEVKKKNHAVISLIKELNSSFKNNDPHQEKEKILSLLLQVRENIAYENHFLLPLLDERMSEEELYYFSLQSQSMGYCLITHE